jgi:serine/threonine-protein kinase
MNLEGARLGAYHLTRYIGSGVAGSVYLAVKCGEMGHGGRSAVKVVHGTAYDPLSRGLAEQVGQLAALRHSAILPIHQVGEDELGLYIAMDYQPSGSLEAQYSAISSRHGRSGLHPQIALTILQQLATGLHEAHRQGLVHGDVKLSNIFVRVTQQGRPIAVASDFGQALLVSSVARTQRPSQVRALLCLAPEQFDNVAVPASDQYALAAVGYLLLTGHYPFPPQLDLWRRAVLHEPPRRPSLHNPTLGAEEEAVLLRALAKDPASRFETVMSFIDALTLAFERHGSLAEIMEPMRPLAESSATGESAPKSSDRDWSGPVREQASECGAPAAGALSDPQMRVTAQMRRSGQANAQAAAPVAPTTGEAPVSGTPGKDSGRSGGQAVRHVASYLIVGVASTLVNLGCFQFIYGALALPLTETVRYFAAYLGAAEAATMFNFVFNDRYTFAHMPGHNRPWIVRCGRFHTTVINGFVLTLVVSGGLHYLLGLHVLIGQAVGIFVALCFNFTVHHLWTYRPRRAHTYAKLRA